MNDMSAPIHLNGRPVEVTAASLSEVLAQVGIDSARRGIAVALNGAVVPRDRWPASPVVPGDELEVINATQGG